MEVAAYHGVIGDGLIGVDPMLIWLVVWNHGIYFPIYWEYGGGFLMKIYPLVKGSWEAILPSYE